MTKHMAIYPGTFDPITRGHLDIIERCQKLFDEVVVAVAEETSKSPLFSVAERIEMIKEETSRYSNVDVESFKGLLIDYVENKGASVIVRGLRVISDFEYEFQMALTNRELAPAIETVFLMTSENYSHISSKFIKEIAKLGGRLEPFVTPGVAARLKRRFGG